ncbi:uncharacterized protein LOC136028233 [Artemia franciscana]|uniref:uncharacterized protein LOC136028233 n=1 Tax=Artemia franciscana TaxID=6661 RepID=UPI0032D9F908
MIEWLSVYKGNLKTMDSINIAFKKVLLTLLLASSVLTVPIPPWFSGSRPFDPAIFSNYYVAIPPRAIDELRTQAANIVYGRYNNQQAYSYLAPMITYPRGLPLSNDQDPFEMNDHFDSDQGVTVVATDDVFIPKGQKMQFKISPASLKSSQGKTDKIKPKMKLVKIEREQRPASTTDESS